MSERRTTGPTDGRTGYKMNDTRANLIILDGPASTAVGFSVDHVSPPEFHCAMAEILYAAECHRPEPCRAYPINAADLLSGIREIAVEIVADGERAIGFAHYYGVIDLHAGRIVLHTVGCSTGELTNDTLANYLADNMP